MEKQFATYHPTINLIFFTSIIAMTCIFNHPVLLAISFVSSFAYSIKLNKRKAVIFNIILTFLVLVWTYIFCVYNHFGVTNLSVNIIGNKITLESLVYGFVVGIEIASVIMWMSCVHAIFSKDKIIYLFGRIAPKLSLYLSILFRLVPQIKQRAKVISLAQSCLGRGINQGNIFRRIRNWIRVISIVITWTIEYMLKMSESMKSRGYTLKGRSAFSIYRFDNRDRMFVITIFTCIIVMLMGILLDQTHILYNPEIIINKVTSLSYLFYVVYLFLSLLPLTLQIQSEMKFNRLKSCIVK